MDLIEFQSLLTIAKEYGIDYFYVEHREVFLDAINAAITAYMEDIEPDDYYGEYDIGELFNQNMRFNGYYEELDKESVIGTICEWIKDDVEQEIFEMIGDLPQDILSNIQIVKNNIDIDTVNIESFVDSYFEPSETDYDYHESDYDYGGISEMSILDCIFK